MAKIFKTAKQIEDLTEGEYIFQLTNKVEPHYIGAPPYQPKAQIAPSLPVYDDKRKISREIRFVEGVNTFWVDEQKDVPKESISQRQWTPTFINGTLTLRSPVDNMKILFMFAHDQYDDIKQRVGQKVKFTLANKTLNAEDLSKQLDTQDEAIISAKTATNMDEIKAHLAYMNISILDGFNQVMSDDAIKIAYRKAARSNPELFMKSFGNPAVKIKASIKAKIASSEIDLNKVKGQAHWGETGALITALDLTKDPVDFLVEFAASANGKEFLKKLQNSK